MLKPVPTPDDPAAEARIYSDMPNHVATDEEFRAAVQKGIESAKTGPCRDLEAVSAEIRRSLLAP